MKNVRGNNYYRGKSRRNAKAIAIRVDNIFTYAMLIAIVVLFANIAFGGTKGYKVKVSSFDHLNEGYREIETYEAYRLDDTTIEPKEFVVDYNITSVDLDACTNEVVSTKEVVEEKVISSSWTEEDRDYLIKVLTGECQTSSFEDQLKYGSVVLNRVASKEYPNSIKDVVLDKKYGVQYSCAWDGNMYRTPNQTSIKAAEYLLENGSVFPSNVIYQAEFKQGKGVYEKCGNTYFCYD